MFTLLLWPPLSSKQPFDFRAGQNILLPALAEATDAEDHPDWGMGHCARLLLYPHSTIDLSSHHDVLCIYVHFIVFKLMVLESVAGDGHAIFS